MPTSPPPPPPPSPSPPPAGRPPAPRRTRRRLGLLLAALLLAAVAGGYFLARTYVPPFARFEYLWKDAALARLSPEEFEAEVRRDAGELRGMLSTLDRLAEELAALKRELPPDAAALSPAQRRRLKDAFAAYLDCQIGLDRIRGTYQPFPGIPLRAAAASRWRHARSFALAYLAHLAQIGAALDFVDGLAGRRDYENILDEAEPERGIPAGCYARLKLRAIHVQTWAEVQVLERYLDFLRPGHYAPCQAAAPAAPDAWVVGAIDARQARVRTWYSNRAPDALAGNAADLVREDLFAAWFPLQRNVSEWLGDTRVRGRASLISQAELAELQPQLRSGDILLERRNWYLSNVGIPGFWPHAALYLGTLEEAAGEFDADAECREYWRRDGAAGFAAGVARRFPAAVAAWRAPVAGEPPRVLEAVSEGVIFSSFEHTGAADYLAGLRPRLAPLDRMRAVLAALAEWGKPYDFNFDFATGDALVCSELVYQAYLPGEGKRGLALPLEDALGRKVFTPTGFVRLLDAPPGEKAAPLEFVFFLDGMEREGRARAGTAAELRATETRPKWDILQK